MPDRDFHSELPYVGHSSQLFEVKDYRFSGGRADGVRATDVDNGSGLRFTVLADRCMDLSRVSFQGVNFGFMSPVSVVAPQYYEPEGLGFLRSFTAGFLTTCGLTNIGSPCEYNGEPLGLHGRISNTPAEEYAAIKTDGGSTVQIIGKMHEGRLFGENLQLSREITCKYRVNRITIKDTVENPGYRDVDFGLLYHINFAYPLLSEAAKLILPTKKVTPRTEFAAQNLELYDRITPPVDDLPEMCYYHELKANAEGKATVGLYNPELELGASVTFSTKGLDHFLQWKAVASGEYVLGLEPCNATIDGKQQAKDSGCLKTIRKGESLSYELEFCFLQGEDGYREAVKRANL